MISRGSSTPGSTIQTLRMIGKSRGRQETQADGRGFYFGVYADVLVPGLIHVGDVVALVD